MLRAAIIAAINNHTEDNVGDREKGSELLPSQLGSACLLMRTTAELGDKTVSPQPGTPGTQQQSQLPN